ncbi:MAG: ferritin-like domain-containing protein [Pseudomonadota bacterium]
MLHIPPYNEYPFCRILLSAQSICSDPTPIFYAAWNKLRGLWFTGHAAMQLQIKNSSETGHHLLNGAAVCSDLRLAYLNIGSNPVDTLKDLYIDQLQDLYSANKQSLKATEKLSEIAKNDDLRRALKNGVDGIGDGIDAVAGILCNHNADPDGEFCKGMEGLVKEVHAHALNAEFGDDDVRDASIITQYQRMTHYGLAGYGCVVAFAHRLGLAADAERLQTCLDNTYGGDREMTRIAQGGVNRAAAA